MMKRYLLDKCENRPGVKCDAYMHEQDDGDYVLHADAQAALAEKDRRIEQLRAGLEKTVWRFRSRYPNDPYCELCGNGFEWASKRGHQANCALYVEASALAPQSTEERTGEA